jgi:hypothetical protein
LVKGSGGEGRDFNGREEWKKREGRENILIKSSDICTIKIVVKVDNLGKINETIK